MVRRVELDREVTLERAVREVVDDASRPMDGVVVTPGIAKLAAIAEPRCFFNPTNPGQPPRMCWFRNFENYRLRLLLRCGAPWQTRPVVPVRPRQPRISA